MKDSRNLTFTVHTSNAEEAAYVASLTDDATGDTILSFDNLDALSEPVRDSLAPPYQNPVSAVQDTPFLQGVINLLTPQEIIGGLQCKEIVGHNDRVRVTDGNFGYYINLDERGDFSADVRDSSGATVFSFDSLESVSQEVEHGFIGHAKDIGGIEKMLVSRGLIPDDGRLQPMAEHENQEQGIYEEGETLYLIAMMRNHIFEQADRFDDATLRVEVDVPGQAVTIFDRLDPEETRELDGEEAAAFISMADYDAVFAVIDRETAYKAHAMDTLDANLSPDSSPSMG